MRTASGPACSLQALLPEAIVPLTLLRPTAGNALLCGDPKQLGPVVRSLQAAAGADGHGLAVSLLERFTEYNSAQAPARRRKGLAPATGAPRVCSSPAGLLYTISFQGGPGYWSASCKQTTIRVVGHTSHLDCLTAWRLAVSSALLCLPRRRRRCS